MSRDEGFSIADTDTSILADPKILVLARRLHDSIRTGAAIALYDAVRLASWKAGHRLTLDETVPGWWLDPIDDLADELAAVGLLDAERRIPARAWKSWFGPARDRRQRFRDLGSRGGKAAHPPLDRTLDRTPEPVPFRSDRSDRSVPWQGFGPEWDAFKEVWTAKGLRLPPYGRDGEPGSQRALIWSILDARPTDAVRWCREAKGSTGKEVVGYILDEWRKVKNGER